MSAAGAAIVAALSVVAAMLLARRFGGVPVWDRVDLMSFHRLVPAAEELDLAEEAAVDRQRVWVESFVRDLEQHGDDHLDPADVEEQDPPEDEAGLSYGQVLGLLEVELGARPLDD